MAAIELKDLTKSFRGTEVLTGVSLHIRDGEFMALLGASGSGKSTLLRTIAGLEHPDSGSILIDGRAVEGLRPADRNMAMVFQHYALYPHMSVRENISLPLRVRRLSWHHRLPGARLIARRACFEMEAIDAKVGKIAELLGIHRLLDRRPAQLSGGQKQRVAMARAMVREPCAFLMDEPLSNLDAALRQSIRAEIVALHKKLRTTFVYVTHDQVEAMTMSDRIALLTRGQVLQVGTPEEIYRQPSNLEVARFVGAPEINVLDVVAGEDGAAVLPGMAAVTGSFAPGCALSLGVRPEDVELTLPDRPRTAEAAVERVEYLGSDVHAVVRLTSGQALVARCSASNPISLKLGTTVGVGLPLSRILVFGPDGKRVEPIAPAVQQTGT